MNSVFVDTQYFIATFQESDQWHERAKEVELQIVGYKFVTTDSIFCEVLNYFSGYGVEARQEVSAFIHVGFNTPSACCGFILL